MELICNSDMSDVLLYILAKNNEKCKDLNHILIKKDSHMQCVGKNIFYVSVSINIDYEQYIKYIDHEHRLLDLQKVCPFKTTISCFFYLRTI